MRHSTALAVYRRGTNTKSVHSFRFANRQIHPHLMMQGPTTPFLDDMQGEQQHDTSSVSSSAGDNSDRPEHKEQLLNHITGEKNETTRSDIVCFAHFNRNCRSSFEIGTYSINTVFINKIKHFDEKLEYCLRYDKEYSANPL